MNWYYFFICYGAEDTSKDKRATIQATSLFEIIVKAQVGSILKFLRIRCVDVVALRSIRFSLYLICKKVRHKSFMRMPWLIWFNYLFQRRPCLRSIVTRQTTRVRHTTVTVQIHLNNMCCLKLVNEQPVSLSLFKCEDAL